MSSSEGIEARILHACYEYMKDDASRLTQNKDNKFFGEFATHISSSQIMKKLLQRGSYEDLSRQWQPYGRKQQNWEFSRILNDDQIQKLTTSGLIDAMKNPDTKLCYDFEHSQKDIESIQVDLQEFLQSEAKRVMQNILDKPRFCTKGSGALDAFKVAKDQPQGLLTRIHTSPASLKGMKQDVGSLKISLSQLTDVQELLSIDGKLCPDDSYLVKRLDQQRAKRDNPTRKMTFDRHNLALQKLVAQYEARIDLSSTLSIEEKVNGLVNLNFYSLGISHLLSACKYLVQLYKSCPHQGRKVQIDDAISSMQGIAQNKQDKFLIQLGTSAHETLAKCITPQDFDGTSELMSIMTKQPYADDLESSNWEPKESYANALEHVATILRMIQVMGLAMKQDDDLQQDVNQFFMQPWALEQSEQAYKLLFTLLEQTKELAESLSGAEAELARVSFDKVAEILLNNLNALFHSERSYLDIVFKVSTTKQKQGKETDWLQDHFYPELLRMLGWRQFKCNPDDKSFEKKLEYLCDWQKLLPFKNKAALQSIYEEFAPQNAQALYDKHKQYFSTLIDFDNDVTGILADLKVEEKPETKDCFQQTVDKVNIFLMQAIEQKSHTSGLIIQETFRSVLKTEPGKNKQVFVYDKIFQNLKSILFLASDNRQSKIAAVVKDLLDQDAEIKLNPSTEYLLRMITADAVNVLKNVAPVQLTTKGKQKMKVTVPWKTVIQKQTLAAGDRANSEFLDFSTNLKKFDEETLPQIVEFGLHITSYVAGISVTYRDGTVFERKGSTPDNMTYESIRLADNEYITSVVGRVGCWTDQVEIRTNLGQVLKGGGNGGNEKKLEYIPTACIIGFDMKFHHHLTWLEVHYVNLDEVDNKQQDPIVSLISESDLLAKGIEQSYMKFFSQKTIDEIKTIQALTGKNIVDPALASSQKEVVVSGQESSTTTMISTSDGPISGLQESVLRGEDDLHMHIIHAGSNEDVDDFIQVLQLLLKESREPIRTQFNILQDNGMAVTRACFATIVKLSGLTHKIENLLQAIELQQPDMSSNDPKERIKELKEIVKSQGNDVTLILNEWCSATKMRKWLKDECQAQGIDSTNSEPKFKQIIQSVVSKAQFLVKLERPHFYQSLNPNQEIFELSYKIPSYARDDKKDLDEIAETDKGGASSNVWREHYNSWKTSLKKQGTIRSQQQKLSEIRQIGTSAIIVCLQHCEITRDCLLQIVEANFLNSCYRLAGLHLLELVCSILEKDKASVQPSKVVMDCIQNVTAALSKGIRATDSDQCHYLDGIKSCGDHLEGMVRSSFFNIVRSISQYFQHADKNDLKNLYSCLDWSFKARDFESLLNLNVFKLLHTGSSEQVKKTPGKSPIENTVLKSWTMHPKGELTKQLQVLSSNLYMAIVSRLAEPEARKIIFDKKDTEATGVSTLSRASSAVCVNTAQALLAQEFNIMFREFNEFVLVANKLDKYIEFSTLEQYFKADEKADHLLDRLPSIVSGVIAKIISNAPYENYSTSAEEESKSKVVTPEEVKIEIAEEIDPVPKKKYYSLSQYTQEQIDVLQAVDAGQELTEQQRQLQAQIQEQQEENALGGMFDDEYGDELVMPKEEQEPVTEKMLTRNDSDIPKLRQKIMQVYRTYAEDNNIARYLDLVTIFVKIATKAPYPLEMLQNVANPYFIKTLLQMLFQVSVRSKLKILSIFQTLVRIQVPLSIFDESVKDLKVQLRTDTSVKFESSFAKFLFQSALQIQASTWDSAFSEEKRGGMYDVSVQLTKTVALILKIRDQAKKAESCSELSQACIQISKDELTAFEVSTVMQVFQATCSMPVIGDTVLFTKQNQSSQEPATAQQLHWNYHVDLFNLKYSQGCLILPEFVPDSLIPIKLSQEALSSLTVKIKDLSKAMPNEKLENVIQLVFLLKLLLLQNMQSGTNGLNSLSSTDRQSLVKSLRSIFAFQGSHTAKTGDLYITSQIEFVLALHSRDQIEQILSSGVDPFDSTSQPTLIAKEESKQVKKQNTSKGKVNSAAGKYSKELLNKAKKKKAGAKAAAPQNIKQNLMNALFKDVFATVDEIIEMNAQVSEYCQQSGCSLLEVLIALNEACSKEKKHFTSESIVEMANERLERLAENQDPSKDSEIESELVEQVTKKIEKIVALYKPDQFKTEVLENLNLSAAIKIVQDGSHGLCNLLTTRVQERIFENIVGLKVLKEEQSSWMNRFKTDRSHGDKAKNISNEENKTTLALTLAKRFAQKLLTSMFDPQQDICGESEAQDIADVIAGVQPVSLKKCFDSAFKHITDGLGSYADSIQMLNISDGTECVWEVSFTENFKVESNLSSNLDSMRELVDYAITVDKLKIRSRDSLASKAQHLLNERLVSSFQETEELQAQSKEFIHYLFQKLIAKTYDDLLLQQPALSVSTSSLVKNILKGSQTVCNFELVERVKLIVNAVLNSNDTSILGVNGSQLFDLTMYVLVQDDTGADQQRLLLDQAFQIVRKFDSDCLQQDAAAQGTWRMIVRSQVLKVVLKLIESCSNMCAGNILTCLIHDLAYLIQSLDKKFAKTSSYANDLGSEQKKWFELNKDLKEMQFETQMVNICIDQEKHHKVFEKSTTVAIDINKNQMVWQPIELGFVDGAQTIFNLKAKNEEETEKLNGNSFELSYRANEGAQVHSKKIIFGEPIEPITISDQALEVCCVSNSVTTNVKQVDQEHSKFIHTSGAIKYVLGSKQGKCMFFVTDLTVYEVQNSAAESEAARSQQLSVPKDLDLKTTKIAEIVKYQDGYIFKTTEDKIHLSANLPQDTVPADIKGSKVVKSFLQKETRAFITSGSQIHSQNLFKKVADEQSLTKVSLSEKVANFRDGDQVVDLQMQGEQPGGCAVLTILRRENKVLFMKGDKEQSFYGLEAQINQFKPVSNQNSGSSFEKVFLFDKIAFTTDQQEQLWILGGKLPIEDNSIFPLDFDQDFFNRPTKSNFAQAARKVLNEPEATQIHVKDVQYSEQIILIDVSVKSEQSAAYQVMISLKVSENSSEPYLISKVDEPNAFIFEGKLWSITAPSESTDDQQILPMAELEVIVKPLKYNIDNITPDIISTLDPSCDLVEELTQTQKLMKNSTAVRKVYKAMNDFVKSEYSNQIFDVKKITGMLNEAAHTEEMKATDPYNPIRKCWDQSLTQKDGEKLVKAIVAINAKYFKLKDEVFLVSKKVFTDPLLEDSLLRERIDPNSDAPSLDFCLRFYSLNEFVLSSLQDSGFKAAEKPLKSSQERVQIALYRFKASQMAIEGKVDRGKGDTIFTQVFDAIEAQEKENYPKVFRVDDSSHRVWRANFQGEGSYDIGGPYRESQENISNELSSSVLPVLIPTENQRHEHGEMRECFVLNHQATTSSELKQIYNFGLMIGFGIRSGQSWNIALHPIIWKQIVGTPLDPSRDLETSDKFMHQMFEQMRLQAIQTENEEDFLAMIDNQSFTVDFGLGETELVPDGANMSVTKANLEQYIRLASLAILRKASVQTRQFMAGVEFIVPQSACRYLSWRNAEIRAMGESTIDIQILRKYTNDESGYDKEYIDMFFEVLQEMSEEDKQKYLKFVNGRAKMSANPAEGRKHKISQGPKKDDYLPQAHTCFFEIDLPRYSSKEIMSKRILTAIRFCGEIDTD